MQYIDNILYIAYDELVGVIISRMTYEAINKTGQIKNIKGGLGTGITLIAFESLPQEHKISVLNHYGNVGEYACRQQILNKIVKDSKAFDFYRDYVLPNGIKLSVYNSKQNRKNQIDYVKRYTENAEWLNMIVDFIRDRRALKAELNIFVMSFWNIVTELIEDHKVNLPTNPRRLKDKVKKFSSFGYESLIEKHKFGNPYAKKVASDSEKEFLITALKRHHEANNNEVAVIYNTWAKENGYKSISANTVRYRKEEWTRCGSFSKVFDSQ